MENKYEFHSHKISPQFEAFQYTKTDPHQSHSSMILKMQLGHTWVSDHGGHSWKSLEAPPVSHGPELNLHVITP